MSSSAELPAELRHDVRLLSTMLGEALTESVGEDLLADVERLRTLAIDGEIERADELVAGFTDERAEQVARAFTAYFHLANLAEEYHRVRVLARRDTDDEPPREDSFPGAWAALRADTGDDARRRLDGLEFRPVFTAHPTEARRRAVATAIRRIGDLLAARDDPRLGGRQLAELDRQLRAEVDILWRTAPVRAEKPTPADEVRTVLAIFDETLFEVVPRIYRALDAAVLGEGAGRVPPATPAFLRFGSWIGADRDGNPNVSAKTTAEAARIAHDHVLLGLERATTRIGRALTVADSDTPPSRALRALLRAQSGLAEDRATEITERSPGESHRQAMLMFAERLGATRRRDAELGYPDAAAFEADLLVVQESLAAAGDVRSAYGPIQDVIWQVQTFGFHLAELEVRQHAKVHAHALAQLRAGEPPDATTTEVLDTLQVLGRLQRRYGPAAARRYIVSFTRSAADLAAVRELAGYAFEDAEPPEIDVVPLFETFDDLRASTDILAEFTAQPETAARLAATGRRLEVMLGYSDSSKDVGPVSATLALYDAQARITAWAAAENIELTLFHGRGGALGRGGGPANQAVLAQPPGSVAGRFKLTEQGEVIFARYGHPVIARRHVEQVATAILRHGGPEIAERNAAAAERYAEVAARMDEVSRERFHALVRAEGFPAWFAQVTPQEEVGWLSLGSRPARRGLSVESLDDLRAIPWVFAWTQARINLTGWFGLGSALAAVGDEGLLQAAYADWPLFRAMIDNVEMSLAKTDDRIAERYLALGDREDLAGLVLEEMALTRDWLERITGGPLLHDRPVLRRAVELRSPYVDALSLLQLRALRRLRADADAERAEQDPDRRLLLLAVSGVAAGLQNTG